MFRIIGDPRLAHGEVGIPHSRIATVFPRTRTLVVVPGIHATQRIVYVDALNEDRRKLNLPPLTDQEQEDEWLNAVDLILEGDTVLIRPDPCNMALAFEADEMLQEGWPKPKIKFLHVGNGKVRGAVKRRGECWRISPLPRSFKQMEEMIAGSRIAIDCGEIYYYNKLTGTRFLTYHEFSKLGGLGINQLRRHLDEIKRHAGKPNRRLAPEVDFFLAAGKFSAADLVECDFLTLDEERLWTAYQSLCARFREAVPAELRADDLSQAEWRNRMFNALTGRDDELITEEQLAGLGAEFYMQIEWLPGGRIEEGELFFDTAFELTGAAALGPAGLPLCDEKVRGFICNFIRDYGDLEYINIGRVTGSLSKRTGSTGRRDVYVAEIKERGAANEILRIIRMQKWGPCERLDDNKNLLEAIMQSDEYTDYILDRRLGCRQLGMNLPPRTTARRITETYMGRRMEYCGTRVWSTYFERDYVRGNATDKLPNARFEDARFALAFARVLGRAAAPNAVVGRHELDLIRGKVVFDDGDELVLEDASGIPVDIVVADHTGTFVDYERDLTEVVLDYADPVNRRIPLLRDPRAFAEQYVQAFQERLVQVQDEYRRRRRGFDALFKHRPNERGSLAYRWEKVLARLDRANPVKLADLIRSKLKIG